MKTYIQHYPKFGNDVESWTIFISGTTYRADIANGAYFYRIIFYTGGGYRLCSEIEKLAYYYGTEKKAATKEISSRKVLKMAKAMLISLVEQKKLIRKE